MLCKPLMIVKGRRINIRWLITVPIILSAFTHIWNPGGFPDIFYDEGVYMRRALHVLSGQGPQEGAFYDHPYFGQLFLAATFELLGYPNSIGPNLTPESIQSLYAVPRVIMGILAVIDTFLIYEISARRYNHRLAVVAAVLFAVMPISWLTRRILLDSILLPFLLGGILFAMLANDSSHTRRIIWIMMSGIFLGTAIFTKLPVFTMIPLVGYFVYNAGPHKTRNLGVWILPVVIIPLLWPLYGALQGESEFWLRDVIWQSQRQSAGFGSILASFFLSDPIILIMGGAGLVLGAMLRDFFIMLWIVPFVIFLSLIGYVQYFYWIPALPIFMISAALVIEKASSKARMMPYVIVGGIGLFGLVCTTLLITVNATSAQFGAAAYVASHSSDEFTIAASPSYSWLFIYIFDDRHALTDYRDLLFHPLETEKVILISDKHFLANVNAGTQLQEIYNSTKDIVTYTSDVESHNTSQYPYTNLVWNFEGSEVEIREKD